MSGEAEAIKIAGEVLPDLVEFAVELFKLGFSNEEVKEIVKRDIQSRRAIYETMKAEDREALKRKHGLTG